MKNPHQTSRNHIFIFPREVLHEMEIIDRSLGRSSIATALAGENYSRTTRDNECIVSVQENKYIPNSTFGVESTVQATVSMLK